MGDRDRPNEMLLSEENIFALHNPVISTDACRDAQLAKKTERGTRAEIGSRQRAYLRDTIEELGVTPSGLAMKIGVAPSTFTRFLSEPDGSEKTLHATTMDKVEQVRQVNSEVHFPTQAQGQWQSLREEAEQFRLDPGEDSEIIRAVRRLIGDRTGIDPWTLRSRALELEGYMPGDIVLVDLNATAKPGDAVCAQVYDRGSARPSTVMRMLQNAGPVNLLLPHTMDPTVQRPLVVDNDRVLIRGVLLPYRLKGNIAA